MTQQMTVLGIDMAKLVFHVVGMDDIGAVVLLKRLACGELLAFIANVPPLGMGIEACGNAHDWARCIREHGHAPRRARGQVFSHQGHSPSWRP